jgi:Sec-independent protein translocase protein TatA
MSFFGLGGFELMLIGAVALFVLGPKRMLEGIREGRKMYADLKRQRDTLQTLITDAIDLEDLKNQIDVDGIKEGVKTLENDLALDQVAEDVRRAGTVVDKSIPRDWQFTRPPIEVDEEVRSAIPDMNLLGDADGDVDAAKKLAPEADVVSSDETAGLDVVGAAEDDADTSDETDEVKS